MPRQPRTLSSFKGVFNSMIAARMRALNMEKLDDFATYSGIPYSTLYNLVMGRLTSTGAYVKPSIDTLTLLAKALDQPLSVLVYRVAPDAPGAEEASGDLPPVRQLKVQVAGWVGAGPQQMEEIDDQWVAVEERFARGKSLRAFRVRGDSMAAGKRPIYDGDIVLVDASDKGQNTASVVAQLDDGRYVCKMLKDDRFGKLLISANPSHTNGTPTTLRMTEVAEIVGRVVRIVGNSVACADGS